MSVLSKIRCERRGCYTSFQEEFENQGFPGWGHIAGLQNEKGEHLVLHLCPSCMEDMIRFMKGAQVNGLD